MKRFHCGILLTIIFGGGLNVQAQQATEEQMNKALEILRQTSPKPPSAVSTAPPTVDPIVTMPKQAAQQASQGSEKMTADQEAHALEILRGTQAARPAPSPLPTEEAIQQALDEANRISQQRKAGTAPISQETLSEELSVVESEIIKAKQDSGEQPAKPPQGLEAAKNSPGTSAPPMLDTSDGRTMTADQERKALDLLREVSRDIKSQPVAAESAAPEASSTQPAAGQVRTQTIDKPAAQAPSNSATISSREQALAELLRAYLNEEISAVQYHKERSRILAKP